MKRFRHLLLVLPLLLLAGITSAQNKTITGRVTDGATNDGVSGVSVIAANSSGGVTTDADGRFSISVGATTTSLTFSAVGFAPQTVRIGANNTINVSLAASTASMDEVVVIGYGTQKKSDKGTQGQALPFLHPPGFNAPPNGAGHGLGAVLGPQGRELACRADVLRPRQKPGQQHEQAQTARPAGQRAAGLGRARPRKRREARGIRQGFGRGMFGERHYRYGLVLK